MALIDRFIKPTIDKKVREENTKLIKTLVEKGVIKENDPNILELYKSDVGGFGGYPYNPGVGKPAGGVQRYQFDYNHQGNQFRRKPMSNISFQILREYSTTYEVARAAINARKRQITSLEWEIVPLDQSGDKMEYKNNKIKMANDIQLVSKFFDNIGGRTMRFRKFLDMVIEDLLVLDAVALMRVKSKGGDLLQLTPIDAATIKLLVDDFGDTPEPPNTAYYQVIRGALVAELTTDDLIYDFMNPRSSTPYGLAPLETLIIVVSSALRGNLVNLNYLTDGNVPEGFYTMPESWSMQQIKEFQEIWDAYIAGDPRASSRLRFMPPGTYTPAKKVEDMRYEKFAEWLMLCTCALFDVQPQELGFTAHQSTKANASEQSDIQIKRGTLPLANFIREMFRTIIQQDLGFTNLDFRFRGMEDRDELAEAQARTERITSGYSTVDEERADDGLDPIGIDQPFVLQQPTFLIPEMEAEMSGSLNAPKPGQAGNPIAGTQASTNGEQNVKDETTTGARAGTPAKADAVDNSATNNPQTRDAGNSMNQKSDNPLELANELRKFQTFAIQKMRQGKELRPFQSKLIDDDTLLNLNKSIMEANDEAEIKKSINEYRDDIRLRELIAAYELKEALSKVQRNVEFATTE